MHDKKSKQNAGCIISGSKRNDKNKGNIYELPKKQKKVFFHVMLFMLKIGHLFLK